MSESPYLDGRYAQRNPDWHAGDAPHKVNALLAALGAWGQAPRSVVEVGCGTGAVLAGVVAGLGEGVRGVGYDVLAVGEAPSGVARVVGEPWEARAELVLAVDVIEHVADDVGFVRRLGCIAPRLLARVPLEVSVLDVLRPGRTVAAREGYGHVHHYWDATLRALLREGGWEPVLWRYDRVPVAASGPWGRGVQRVRSLALAADAARAARWLGGVSVIVGCERRG